MDKHIYDPNAAKQAELAPVSEGGTFASTIADAVKNLGAVTRGMVGRPLGVAVRDGNGNLPSSFVPESLLNSVDVSLYGSTVIDNGATVDFIITNYDSTIHYDVTATLGVFTRDADVITFVSNGTVGVASLVINGTSFSFYVIEEAVVTPQILFPVDGSTPGYQSSLLVSAASFNSNRDASSHLSSDWEISTNATFTNIVASSYSNTVDLIAWSVTGLVAGTTYYARTRQRADTMRVSDWSIPVSFTMAVTEYDYTVPGTYTFTMASNGTATVLGQGSGGGGGGGFDSIYHSSGLGGGGGSSGESKTAAFTLLKDDVIKIVIPPGGAKGTAGSPTKVVDVDYVNGGNGSPTLIYVNDVLVMTSLGGIGGKTKTSGTGDSEWAYGGAAVGNGTAGGGTRSQVGAAGGNSPTGGIGGAQNTARHTAGNPGTKGAGGGGAGPVTSWSASLPGGGVGGAGYAKLTVAYDQVIGSTSVNTYSVPGVFSYTVGPGVDTAFFYAQGPGGGGAGGSPFTTGAYNAKSGGGGAAGEYYEKSIPVVEGDVITIEVGSGGLGRGPSINGLDGGETVFKKNGVVFLTSLGGAGAIGSAGGIATGTGVSGDNGSNTKGGDGGASSVSIPAFDRGIGGSYQTNGTAGSKGCGGGGGGYGSGNLADTLPGSGARGGHGWAKLVVGKSTTATYLGYYNYALNVTRTYDYVVSSAGYVYLEACGGNVTQGNGVKKQFKVSTGDIIRGVVGASGFAGNPDGEGGWIAPPQYPTSTHVTVNGINVVTSSQSTPTMTPIAAGSMTIKFIPDVS